MVESMALYDFQSIDREASFLRQLSESGLPFVDSTSILALHRLYSCAATTGSAMAITRKHWYDGRVNVQAGLEVCTARATASEITHPGTSDLRLGTSNQ